MDPGERTTGTRDEHYDLISVVYHALQGADACDRYALDAEAAGRADLAAYFRDAQVAYALVAEQGKALLGIPEVPIGDLPQAGVVPPTTDVPRTPEEAALEEEVALEEDAVLEEEAALEEEAVLDEEVALGEEAVLEEAVLEDAPADIPADVPGEPEPILPEDLDPTVSVLRGGVAEMAIEEALTEIEGWRLRLEGSGDPRLLPIADNLALLADQLAAGSFDPAAVGQLLGTLGEQVQGVASSDVGAPIAEKLRVLGGLLNTEGRQLSE